MDSSLTSNLGHAKMSKRRESALVTGAARGIGFAIAKKLASRGINVLLADIEEELCNESAEQLRAEYKVDAIAIRADMTVEEDIKNMVEFAIQRWGRLDWAANNAGVGEQLDDDEEDVTGAQFDK
jgi:NAD(P)-dependent dehydrogenase (short-subunit alcohol dehydrogenase family)